MDQEVCPIVARVDFINAILGDELLRIVEQWQEGLLFPQNEQSRSYMFLRKYSRVIAYAMNYITTFVIIMCIMEIINGILLGFETNSVGEIAIMDLRILIRSIVLGAVFCIFVYKISMVIANIVFTTLRADEEIHIFSITNGDMNLNQLLKINDKKRRKKVTLNILFTFIFNVICSVFANYIS